MAQEGMDLKERLGVAVIKAVLPPVSVTRVTVPPDTLGMTDDIEIDHQEAPHG